MQGSLTEGEGPVLFTSYNLLVNTFTLQTQFTSFAKQATLIRRLTVLSCPLQLVFPGKYIDLTIQSCNTNFSTDSPPPFHTGACTTKRFTGVLN
jgi:hypothetical protein